MGPIPLATRRQLERDPRMKVCINCGGTDEIEWNHALIVAGSQLQEPFAIQPLCMACHRGNFGTIFKRAKLISEYRAIQMGCDVLKAKYPKTNWDQRLKFLQVIIAKIDEDEYDNAQA